MRSLNVKFIPELDQLRGIAALMVLFFHAIAATEVVGRYLGTDPRGIPVADNIFELIVANGFTGVTLFFVISGFIFTWSALQSDRFKWRDFYFNRFLRIYPLYLLVVLTAVFMSYGAVPFSRVLQDLLGFANLGPALGQFDIVIWTIAVEIQFYLIFPFLLMLLRRKGARYLVGLIGVMVALRLIARMSHLDISQPVYWTMFGRLDQFLVGMLLAWWVHARGWMPKLGSRLTPRQLTYLIGGLVASGGVMLALQRYYLGAGWKSLNAPVNIVWPTVEAAMWAVIGVFYVALARRVKPQLLRPVQFVGLVSYSLYLLHYPIVKALYRQDLVITIPNHAFLSGVLGAAFIVLPVSLALAALTFYVIEKPPLDLRRQYAKPAGREEHLATVYGLHPEPEQF